MVFDWCEHPKPADSHELVCADCRKARSNAMHNAPAGSILEALFCTLVAMLAVAPLLMLRFDIQMHLTWLLAPQIVLTIVLLCLTPKVLPSPATDRRKARPSASHRD